MTRALLYPIRKARHFAMAAHAAVGQTRKDGSPYFTHLQAVASMVAVTPRATPEMMQAALLHDILEDTQIPFSLLEDEFGEEVASLVLQVTDVSKPEDGPRYQRKLLDRAHIAKASPGAKTIKLADLIDNTSTIEKLNPKFAKVYFPEKRRLLQVLQEGDPGLLAHATRLVNDYFERNALDA